MACKNGGCSKGDGPASSTLRVEAHTNLMRNILFAATLALVAAGGGGPGGDASPDALQLASNDDLASTISSLGDKTLFLRMFMNG